MIDKKTKNFLTEAAKYKNKQLYEMPVEEARGLFNGMQQYSHVKMPEVVLNNETIKTENGDVPVVIVKPLNTKQKLLPVLIFFHGGGFMFGNYKTHENLPRVVATEADISVVFVEYSLSPENKYPVAINQCYDVTKWIAKNGDKLGLDSNRIAVAGSSAGGNITAVITQMAKNKGEDFIKYQILLSPMTEAYSNTESMKNFGKGEYFLSAKHNEWFWNNYLANKSQKTEIRVSPLLAPQESLEGLPPALVLTGEYDIYRDEGEAYAYKLMQAGVDVTAVRYLGTLHSPESFAALADTPPAKSALKQIIIELKDRFNV